MPADRTHPARRQATACCSLHFVPVIQANTYSPRSVPLMESRAIPVFQYFARLRAAYSTATLEAGLKPVTGLQAAACEALSTKETDKSTLSVRRGGAWGRLRFAASGMRNVDRMSRLGDVGISGALPHKPCHAKQAIVVHRKELVRRSYRASTNTEPLSH